MCLCYYYSHKQKQFHINTNKTVIMSDVIVSAVAERLMSLIEDQARYHINLVRGVEKEVRSLAKDLETVRDVLDDAEKKQFKDKSVKNWLLRLEQTSLEMEDVLDEWNYAILKFQMEGDRSDGVVVATPKQKVWSFIPSCSCLCFKEVALRHGIAKKIIDVKEKLDEVLKQDERYKLRISQPNSDPSPNSWRDKSTSFANLDVIYGRDLDRDILVTKLMGREEELGFKVVSIVGVGGLGKTSLAQLVYNNSQVENSFDLRIWVCVSDPFDLVSIAKGILESMKKGNPSNTTHLDSLLSDVQNSIQGKRFLLVLDDVWTEDSKKWEPLKTSLKCGGAGSKVLVTTRNQNVAVILDTMEEDIHHLGKLTNEECRRLLCKVAFSGSNRENFESFKDMSEGIAKKCKGLPLAAKVLGSLLCTKSSLEEWENVLNSEIWQLEKAELELFPHLILSYNELSPMHKRCFSYCAVFPKDSRMDVKDLIGEWMAVGYLGSNISDMELKGRECFEILATRSLFQDFNKDDFDGEIMSCKMHDIVHDFALSIRKSGRSDAAGLNKTTCGACDLLINPSVFSIVDEFSSFFFLHYCDGPQRICTCLKRLRVLALPGIPQGMEKLIHLRWLKMVGSRLSYKDLKIIFKLYNLQTLSILNCKLKEIPREIDGLIHLRDLNLSFCSDLEKLPESISSLKELRTLNVEYCESLIRLPEGMHRLKHLLNAHTKKLEQLPQGLAQQTGLRTLGELRVGGNGFSKLGLLKNLNLLTGSLHLKIRLSDDYGVEDAVKDAREAELREKIHLQQLIIKFEVNNEEGSSIQMGILEALEPYPNLKRLRIKWYQGLELPSWITASPLIHLKSITIQNCYYVSSLPPLRKLVCLEEINILKLKSLKFVGREFLGITTGSAASTAIVSFPKLKKLTFHICSNWKEWEDITAEEEESADLRFMPCLTNLTLYSCRNLTELPRRLLRKMSSLEKLNLTYSEALQKWCQEERSSDGKSIFRNPRLQIDTSY